MNWPHDKVVLLPVLALMVAYAAEPVRALFKFLHKPARISLVVILILVATVIDKNIYLPMFNGVYRTVSYMDDNHVFGEIKIANYIMSNSNLGEKFVIYVLSNGAESIQSLVKCIYAAKYDVLCV